MGVLLAVEGVIGFCFSERERDGDGEERWRGEWPGDRSIVLERERESYGGRVSMELRTDGKLEKMKRELGLGLGLPYRTGLEKTQKNERTIGRKNF